MRRGGLSRGQRFSRGVRRRRRRGGQPVRARVRSRSCLLRMRGHLVLRVAQLVRLRKLLLLACRARSSSRGLTGLRGSRLERGRVGRQLRRARYRRRGHGVRGRDADQPGGGGRTEPPGRGECVDGGRAQVVSGRGGYTDG